MLKLRSVILIWILFAVCSVAFANTQTAENANFIAISDIHFNPFYSCDKKIIYCPVIKKLQDTPADKWAKVLAQYDNNVISPYGNDTNYALLKSSLTTVRQSVEQNHPKFIMILGDFLSHDYKANYQLYSGDLSQKGYEAFVKKTMQFLTLQIHQTLPNIPIYPVVGNNDSYTGDYSVVPQGKFFKDTGKIWKPLLQGNNDTFAHTFPVAGYYAVSPISNQKLRLIILNSVLFAKPGDQATQEAALQELAWLKAQLQIATQQQQKVWLITHVPVGINVYNTLKAVNKEIIPFWLTKYADIFQQIVSQYSNTITAMLTGHIHMDGFQFIKAPKPIPNSFVPAISPMFGNNPSFKKYDYSTTNLELQDFITYYLNELAGDSWQVEYRFSNVYQPGCKTCDLISRMQAIKKKGLTASAYQIFYAASTHAQPITEGKWLPYYWCAIHNLNISDYQLCLDSEN